MTPEELETYVHTHIPITGAMGVAVESISAESVVLSAPLEPNINHRETVFGGSASAVAILAAWALVMLRLRAEGRSPRLVVRRNTMSYDAPIAGRFTARSFLAPDADWDRFTKMLDRRGTARIDAHAELRFEDAVAGRLDAEFVAIGLRDTRDRSQRPSASRTS